MKRTSIRDVAKVAGVSVSTVSKALNGYADVNQDTKKRIEEVVRDLNYVPDTSGRRMAGISMPVIGLLINDLKEEDHTGAVYGFLSGVCLACKDNGIDFLLLTTDAKSQAKTPLSRIILEKHLSGLVCCGFKLGDPYISQLSEQDIPCASIDLVTEEKSVIDVTIDNQEASRLAVKHLIDSGRSNIAFIGGGDRVDVAIRRKNGYIEAIKQSDIKINNDLMVNADFDRGQAYLMSKEMIESKKVDAFFCISDLMALGVCQAILESGYKIGKEIAVVGFDDIPIAQYVYGGITTIHQDFYNTGYRAGSLIYKRIIGEDIEDIEEDNLYSLVIRASSVG